MSGILYICGTPIGNLEDITFRQIRILKEVDLIACEDTRHTIKLLNHYEINNRLISYHEHNIKSRGPEIIAMLEEGKNIALVSDAGMPGISDPGEDLIRLCYEKGIQVTAVPGPTAVITAVVLSGLSCRKYLFEGFFPKDKKEQSVLLQRLKKETYTTVFYEAPHRLLKTLKLLEKELNQERIVSCVKEMTKKHEIVIRLNLAEAAEYYEKNEPKGEFVVVLEGISQEIIEKEKIEEFNEISIEDHMNIYLNKGIDRKEAMKLVAKDRGLSKRDIYAYLNK